MNIISLRKSDFFSYLIRLTLAVTFAIAASSALAAGYQRLEVPATSKEPAISALLWTPCAETAGFQQIGPISIQGNAGCPLSGHNLPLIIISHGYGGSFLGHHDTATALANAGFVVVSLNHLGDNTRDKSSAHRLSIFETRPLDVSRVISFMLQSWSERQKLNIQAIGVFGFSRGGYTALALAGGIPNLHASEERFCNDSQPSQEHSPLCSELKNKERLLRPVPDARVRAIVVADPLNLFDTTGLRSVRIPVQLWASEYGGDGVARAHVEAIKAALTLQPDYHLVTGAGHFVFLAPCPPALVQSAPDIYRDPKGFSREAWHRTFNDAVVSFFRHQLLPEAP